jgi:hypothetical protein
MWRLFYGGPEELVFAWLSFDRLQRTLLAWFSILFQMTGEASSKSSTMNMLSTFLVHRIREIRIGLGCSSYGRSYFLPASIVTVLKINKTGTLWSCAGRCPVRSAPEAAPVQAKLRFLPVWQAISGGARWPFGRGK